MTVALSWWQIVCPDGNVRHYPYAYEAPARVDAKACSRSCRMEPKLNKLEAANPPCANGKHTVREIPAVDRAE